MRNVPLGSNFETAVWLVERLQDRVWRLCEREPFTR